MCITAKTLTVSYHTFKSYFRSPSVQVFPIKDHVTLDSNVKTLGLSPHPFICVVAGNSTALLSWWSHGSFHSFNSRKCECRISIIEHLSMESCYTAVTAIQDLRVLPWVWRTQQHRPTLQIPQNLSLLKPSEL